MDVCVLCVLYSKVKRHSQDNQDKEVVPMKYREENKNHTGGIGVFVVCKDKEISQGKEDKQVRKKYKE
jgi:hypothetical protein